MTDEGGGASITTDPAAGSSAPTDVSLREYEASQRHWMIALFLIVWFFIERHLLDLNHENARVAKVSENSVSSDTYNANEQQRRSEQHKLDDRLAKYDENFTKSVTRDDLTRETKGDKQTNMGLWISAAAIIVAIAIASITIILTRGSVPAHVPTVPSSAVVCTATYHPTPCPQP